VKHAEIRVKRASGDLGPGRPVIGWPCGGSDLVASRNAVADVTDANRLPYPGDFLFDRHFLR
jgi:hypothetical protein